MASSSSRMASYSIQRTIVPTKALSCSRTRSYTSAPIMASSSSRMVSYSIQRRLVPTSSLHQLKNWELHISSKHDFIKLRDGKLLNFENSSRLGFIKLKNWELHISSNHGFIKLKDGKLFNSKNKSSNQGLPYAQKLVAPHQLKPWLHLAQE
jgi:hypothetical protein